MWYARRGRRQGFFLIIKKQKKQRHKDFCGRESGAVNSGDHVTPHTTTRSLPKISQHRMDPSQPNSREYQQQAIDAEIKSLEESIRVLKYRRNALAPVSSLPTEVIDAIFLFSRVTVSGSSATPGETTDPLAWLRVAHVCHRWREIALNQPLFWNHVNFTILSSAGAAEIVARAKTAPLYLEARVLGSHWDDARYSAFQEKLQVCVPRTCHLLISANQWNIRKTLDSLVSPAPALETLSLFSERLLQPWGQPLQPDIPETLFGGATPRLSCLQLRNCNISWKSPLLKGLRILEIGSPMTGLPSLPDWLDALDEMPHLKMLTLDEASSPTIFSFPFHVERTVTLPSLTNLKITDYPRSCAVALAHLDLPALTCLCIQTYSCMTEGGEDDDVEEVLPYVTRLVHTQPLQSMLIRGKHTRMDILAWPVPDIEHEPPTLSTTTPSACVALSITGKHPEYGYFPNNLEFLDTVMAALPLDGLATLIAQDLKSPLFEKFWHHNSLKWFLLRRVRLTPIVATKFTDWLLEDKGGYENPLLPLLEELVLVDAQLDERRTRGLCDALMKRVEQGVPLELLDLRTCSPDPDTSPRAVQLLSEIVVNVLGPEETLDGRAQIRSMWDRLDYGPLKYDDDDEDDEDDDNSNNNDDDDDEDDDDEDDDDDDDDDDDSDHADDNSSQATRRFFRMITKSSR
jgi:hypothetical protein